MNNLIVFRGDYSYVNYPEKVCDNINKYIIEPMKEKKYDIDIIFSTYETNLDKLKIYQLRLNPVKIFFTKYGQNINFKESLSSIKDIYEKYDYIFFLRFDIIYKININNWNIFNKEGVFFPYKEDSEELFHSNKYYSDTIIIFSKSIFLNAANSLINSNIETHFPILHHIGSIIQNSFPNIKINTILDGYYQSNTSYPGNDIRLSPLYIQVKYPYHGNDKDLYVIYL